MHLIGTSTEDMASMNIRARLLEMAEWNEIGSYAGHPALRHPDLDAVMVLFDEFSLLRDDLGATASKSLDLPEPEVVIYASRHMSESGRRTLTVHPIGCFAKAEHGGRDETLVPCVPNMMTEALRILRKKHKEADLDFAVSFEATHHGPFQETPTFYIEIGSEEKAWSEEKPARLIAETILEVIAPGAVPDYQVVIGAGGGHYVPRVTDVAVERRVAFGHIIPTYAAVGISDRALEQVMEKTPEPRYLFFHRKAIKSAEKQRLTEFFEAEGLRVMREKDFEKI
jgi:D-aminoacyl-tRNA deacylase